MAAIYFNAVIRGGQNYYNGTCHVRSHIVSVYRSSANLYSLIETEKFNCLEPYTYLQYLFTQLYAAPSVEEFEMLLPGNIGKNQFQVV